MASTKTATIKSQCQSSFTSTSSSVSFGVGTEEIDSEMEGWWERKDHPLLNDVILSHLFEFVRSKDLKTCRLVCKKWCVLSLPSARSKFSVKLHGNREEMTGKLTDFADVFRENTLGIPFVEYNMDSFCTTEEPGQKFLQIIGSTAKRVSLTGQGRHVLNTQLTLTVQVEDISELLKAMPNIEYFDVSNPTSSQSGNVVKLFPDNSSTKPTLSFLKELNVRDWDRGETNDCCPTFIEEILSIAPNISDVAVQDYRNNPDRNRIGQVLDAIEKFKMESVIKNMDLNGAHPEHVEYLERLAGNGLKLKNLDFLLARGYRVKDQIKCLPQLARIFKNSLEDLDVDEVCPSFSQLPHMPRLEKLEFKIPWNFDSKCVNLKKLLPALKELVLYSLDLDWEWVELLPNSEPCPNLKALSVGV